MTPTQLQQLARELAEKLTPYLYMEPCDIESIILTALEQVSREAIAPLWDNAAIGQQWKQDSSLAKWFPFTANEIDDLKQQLAEAKGALDLALKGSEDAICAIAKDNAALREKVDKLEQVSREERKEAQALATALNDILILPARSEGGIYAMKDIAIAALAAWKEKA